MNIDLMRADDAYKNIEKLKANGGADRQKYVSYAKALPATILQNGLGQAMATLLSAAKGNDLAGDAHGLLYLHLEGWLCRDDALAPYSKETDLMRAIVEGEQFAYLQAQAESMAYLNWLKKFAVAFLSAPEDKHP